MTDKRLTCAECDELFPDYFEGDLDAVTRSHVDAHAGSCARCQRLIRDIAGIQAQAAALPDLVPSKDLWQGIEARIQPAVVSIGARRETSGMPLRMLFAAAAALVVVTSSVTYVATSRTIGKDRAVKVANQGPAVPAGDVTNETAPSIATQSIDAPSTSETAAPVSSGRASARPTTPKAVRTNRATGSGTALVSRTSAPMSLSERALSAEIGQLQELLRQKRTKLDPMTVQVVEDNLNLIDVAVKQARAALAKDPASGFLTETLDNALQKKVDLLRTVAMLPSKS